ncbi:Uncharacterised protein [BD1-7 clade bacterium]|uniref:Uncharacterized protein n=1 Tax=BD1-7 clade bacterium TaxID=2029982 RepID=A0A5S9Q1X3_9GAMM|nr:Uncharacterised protein [BD1-7 clade bacterium]CAA0111830.1 Uncharacterised protein [BD1-7 clade bacterium]
MSKSITQEQWQAIETELQYFHCRVEFALDGHEILIRKEGIAENRLGLTVYIDGIIEHGYAIEKSDKFNPLAIKVWKAAKVSAYGPKKREQIRKQFGKRQAKQLFPNLEKTHTYYKPWFDKASVLIRQYKKLDGLVVKKIGQEEQSEVAA